MDILQKMKCDNCQYIKTYILGMDECGAGQYTVHCSKGHWDSDPDVEEDDKDYWDNCEDYALQK